MKTKTQHLRLPAIEVRQTSRRKLYSFAVDGKLLSAFAAVSRLHRNPDAGLGGYQRPEVLSHIAGIRNYLESKNPILPNALVVAFDRRVRFKPFSSRPSNSYSRSGQLLIPIDPNWTEAQKPGWIVDGQQRSAAVREANLKRFPLCVTAFITRSRIEQRTQFILVNSTKPLPKGLVYELLPATEGTLPRQLRSRRFPARLLERLNHDVDSPLRHKISTPTMPEGQIKDNSILRMLESSLTDGALYQLRDPGTGVGDLNAMLDVLKSFWDAVRKVFPDAFGLPPRRSRLMHGVGVASLGFIMDAIADRFLPERFPTSAEFASDLSALRPICHWTSGTWTIGTIQRRWNDLQNTPKDIQLLADYLLTEYRRRNLQPRRTIRLVKPAGPSNSVAKLRNLSRSKDAGKYPLIAGASPGYRG
jgi:DGQHR domain-containing protein